MQSTRQNKICKLIQQDMGDIFLKEMKNCPWQVDDEAEKEALKKSLFTVTQVRITPDLSIARIYVSIMVIGQATKEASRAPATTSSTVIGRRDSPLPTCEPTSQ